MHPIVTCAEGPWAIYATKPWPRVTARGHTLGRYTPAMARQVQCEDGEEYKRTLKVQLKALLDGPGLRDSLNGLSEFVVLLVRPPGSDAAAKAPRKVSAPYRGLGEEGRGWGVEEWLMCSKIHKMRT